MNIEEKKKHFPILLANRRGNITKTCQDLNMAYGTYRKWADSDPEFVEKCNHVQELLIDIGQEALIRNVEKGKSSDIQFLLKTVGKSRGYGEKVEIEHRGQISHAHGVMHYPPEPESIEDWEKQVALAKTARPSMLPEGTGDTVDGEYTEIDEDMPDFTCA